MSIMDLFDWDVLEAFLGAHGKIIAAAIAFVVALISLAAAIYRYLHAGSVERTLTLTAKDVRRREKLLERAEAALMHAKAVFEQQREDIAIREKKLKDVRRAFVGKEHELWCMHGAPDSKGYSR